jgi:hypothetical protein
MDEEFKEKPDTLSEIDDAMRQISEAFVSLRSAVGKLHYGEKTDIKVPAAELLKAEIYLIEILE